MDFPQTVAVFSRPNTEIVRRAYITGVINQGESLHVQNLLLLHLLL